MRQPMRRHSRLKKAVLRGVYEDNVGIPRSTQDPRRIRHAFAESAPAPAVASGSAFRNRVLLIVLLVFVAVLGVNFRLIMIGGSGPAAEQVQDKQRSALPATLLYLPEELEETSSFHSKEQVGLEPAHILNDAIRVTSSRYDAMLASLEIPMAELFNLRVRTIVIDPGHGGIDPGATGQQGLKEKDVVLDIARRLQDKLSRSGDYRVLLTRKDDRKVFLRERVAFAKAKHADLFISIHINSLPPGSESVNYLETYYFGPHADQRSLELAEKENRDSDYSMGDFRGVIARIGDTLKTEESRDLADSIHRHLFSNLKRVNHDLHDAGSKTGPFVVLLGVDVPSVLVEVSCISNKAEEVRLGRPNYRDSVADFLKAGIVEYLERRSYPGTIQKGKAQYVVKQERKDAVHRD
jgi:N-acetylmuramoyl-L-alanine amidase